VAKRIVGRYGLESGSGMMNSPEQLKELEERRDAHARIIRGKPKVAFGDLLKKKMKPEDEKPEEEEEEEAEEGGKDPLLGLSPQQDPDLGRGKKGRAGKVIVKG
jgi:hypothetical protein